MELLAKVIMQSYDEMKAYCCISVSLEKKNQAMIFLYLFLLGFFYK